MTGIPIIPIIIGLVVIFLGLVLETITFPVSEEDRDLELSENQRESLKEKIGLDDSYYQLFGLLILGVGLADCGRRVKTQKKYGIDITFKIIIDCLFGNR